MTTKTLTLRAIDIPSIHKFGIGFDSMLDELMRLTAGQTNTNYPPHNVIKTGEETVTIEIAVAGFGEDELDVKLDNNALIVSTFSARCYLHVLVTVICLAIWQPTQSDLLGQSTTSHPLRRPARL